MYSQYKSPLGYQTNDNGIDSYGVDHSNFSLRDELACQLARQQREKQIIQNFHNQGITKDYPRKLIIEGNMKNLILVTTFLQS